MTRTKRRLMKGNDGDAMRNNRGIEVDAMAIWTSPPKVLEFEKNVLGRESYDFKMGRTLGLNTHPKNFQFFLKNQNQGTWRFSSKWRTTQQLVDTTNQNVFRWREIRIFIKKKILFGWMYPNWGTQLRCIHACGIAWVFFNLVTIIALFSALGTIVALFCGRGLTSSLPFFVIMVLFHHCLFLCFRY